MNFLRWWGVEAADASACSLANRVTVSEAPETPTLPNPKTAALLAWLFPGLGHLYQGRRAKGVLFMASIVGLFVAGMVVGGGKVAYASTLPFTPVPAYLYDGWPFVCQSGIGVVAIPGWIERSRYLAGEGPLISETLYPPRTGPQAMRGAPIVSTDDAGNEVRHPDGAAKRRYDLGFRFEAGMVYTVIAGLLNLLVVYDAHSGPLLPEDEAYDEQDGDPTE